MVECKACGWSLKQEIAVWEADYVDKFNIDITKVINKNIELQW